MRIRREREKKRVRERERGRESKREGGRKRPLVLCARGREHANTGDDWAEKGDRYASGTEKSDL